MTVASWRTADRGTFGVLLVYSDSFRSFHGFGANSGIPVALFLRHAEKTL